MQSTESSVPALKLSGDLARKKGGMEAHLCTISAVSEQLLEKKSVRKTKRALDIHPLLAA